MIRVTVWNEFCHERKDKSIHDIYPNGIHGCIADFLSCDDISVRTATLLDKDCGLSQQVLDETDVLLWWGHVKHNEVPDEVAIRVQKAVLSGMGIIFLHSAHMSKPFRLLMGTSCSLTWRESNDKERLWVVDPSHPITLGIDRYFELPAEETYGEPFAIPEPDKLVLIGWFDGGEVFRSGCCYRRDNGKIFYFQPGHESCPTYKDRNVQTVIRNAVYWCKGDIRSDRSDCPHTQRIEKK